MIESSSSAVCSRKVSMKHQRVPTMILRSKGTMASWPFSRPWSISDPILFQVTLVATLLATVLGSCGTPPYLDFAYPINDLNETTFETGTILKYGCRPGYRISSKSYSLTCEATGDWKYNEFCVKKRCGNPGELLNGQVIVKTDYSFGSEIEFSCSEGYILIGSVNSYCEIQGKGLGWSDPLPQCIIVKCEPPPSISNGRHNGGDEDVYTYGSSVTYSCDPDFSMLGKASISCRVENKTIGVWYPSPPTCKKVICVQPVVKDGKITSGFGPIYTYQQSIVYACDKGFRLEGNSLIRCEADSSWNPPPPTCELNGCVGLPHIPHASWKRYSYQTQTKQEVYDIGTVLSYYCDLGYRPKGDGPTTVTCQSNLKWSPYIECEDCGSPPVIAHGRHRVVSKRFIFEDEEAEYECDEGYTLVGANRLSCTSSGWSPAAPQCKALCLKPETEYGRLSVEKVRYVEPERVTIQCDSGYRLVGSENITCSEDRTWYPEVPKCEWEYPEGCEQVIIGRKLLQCLSKPDDVKLALEVYKLSLEIADLQTTKLKNSSQEASLPLPEEREKNVS
ncbi:C4b-binding protein alpha chain isoform X2 [Moschus berezovskii]|uniref:C4b-binding protein alpha chain isoform X2 n=1 Tax=Moschus berezovskii TaxID=68408 RepID=UPI00244539B3|nr:C4b-binding protein alpha chain isoform X2 [Moschus berezovskii]